jgi:putative nucleotidyltransferase with HDIG domain
VLHSYMFEIDKIVGEEMNTYLEKNTFNALEAGRTKLLDLFFAITMCACPIIDGFIYPELNLMGIYIAPLIIGSLAFWKMNWVLIPVTFILTYFRYELAPIPFPHASTFLLQWILYYITAFSVSSLVKSKVKDKSTTLDLIIALSKSLDSRDSYTAFHSLNVANYAKMIADEMKLSSKQCHDIFIGGLLHDIGKIGVPENILTKPTKLTNEEYNIIKQHPVTGYNTLKHIDNLRKRGILDIILYHHERYDGKGYPEGLVAEQIPIVARITAIADAFDAMTSQRIYRDEREFDYVVNEIRKNKGKQFDPTVADVFLAILEKQGKDILYNESKQTIY